MKNYTKATETSVRSIQYLVIQEFKKAQFEVFSREGDSSAKAMESEREIESKKGSDLVVKTPSGRYHEIYVQPINLDKERNVKIPKEAFGQLKSNLWIALVLTMTDMEPAIDLIPSEVFKNPDNYIFIDNDQSERFKSLSNWEIKVFKQAIPVLGKYALANMVSEFV